MSNVTVVQSTMNDFAVVHSEQELQDKLAQAKAEKVPVLVDFYADWCTSCVLMEKQVFANYKVQNALKPFMLVRVDLSANTEEDQLLLKKYNVIAPPSVLFFNASGKEVESRRIVGELNAKDFLNRIEVFMAGKCIMQAQC
jgi:thiol:disulfide interchange protein DsbD